MWPCRRGRLCRGSGLCPSACGFSAAAPPARCTFWTSASVSRLSSPLESSHHCHCHRSRPPPPPPAPHYHHHHADGPVLWEPAETGGSSKMTLKQNNSKDKGSDAQAELGGGAESLKRTVVSAASTSGASWYPESFMFTDSPGRRGGERWRIFLCESVGIDAAEFHHVEQSGEIVSADPNRDIRGLHACTRGLLTRCGRSFGSPQKQPNKKNIPLAFWRNGNYFLYLNTAAFFLKRRKYKELFSFHLLTRTLHLLSLSVQSFPSQLCPHHPTL